MGASVFLLVTLSLTAKLPPFWKNTPQDAPNVPEGRKVQGRSPGKRGGTDLRPNWVSSLLAVNMFSHLGVSDKGTGMKF